MTPSTGVLFALALMVTLKVIHAVDTEGWRTESLDVSLQSAKSRVMLYTDSPTQATITFHFLHYQPYANTFTIAQSRVWHIIEISKLGKYTLIRGPVANLDVSIPYKKLLKVSVSSNEPVQWLVCGYTCSLPLPAANKTCTENHNKVTKGITPTTTTTTTSVPVATGHQTRFTANATRVISIITTLVVVCVIFITTTLVLAIYICCLNNNSAAKKIQPPAKPPRAARAAAYRPEGENPSAGSSDPEGGYLNRIQATESVQPSAPVYPGVALLNIDSSAEPLGPSTPLYPGDDHDKGGSTQSNMNRLSGSIAH